MKGYRIGLFEELWKLKVPLKTEGVKNTSFPLALFKFKRLHIYREYKREREREAQ